jgi:hypothetical protein
MLLIRKARETDCNGCTARRCAGPGYRQEAAFPHVSTGFLEYPTSRIEGSRYLRHLWRPRKEQGIRYLSPLTLLANVAATVWHSKGYKAGNILMANRTVESMWRWNRQGFLPIVSDASSCTLGLKQEVLDYLTPENRDRQRHLTIYDSITWAHEKLLPNLKVKHRVRSATLHETCSMHTLGIDTTLRKIASELAETVFYPWTSTCCAFAGDRGLLHEELTRSATKDEASEVTAQKLDLYLCANRTCEVGIEHATHAPYESFYLRVGGVDTCVRRPRTPNRRELMEAHVKSITCGLPRLAHEALQERMETDRATCDHVVSLALSQCLGEPTFQVEGRFSLLKARVMKAVPEGTGFKAAASHFEQSCPLQRGKVPSLFE